LDSPGKPPKENQFLQLMSPGKKPQPPQLMSPGKEGLQSPFQLQPMVAPVGRTTNSAELPNVSSSIGDYFPDVAEFQPATEAKLKTSTSEPVAREQPRSYLAQNTNLVSEALEKDPQLNRGKGSPAKGRGSVVPQNVAKKDHEKSAKANNPYMKMQTLAGDIDKRKKADEKKRRWADDEFY
jgi:hypothetical protein